MASILFGLLCLWFVSVGGTESSLETNLTNGLFAMMDSQNLQDNKITYAEYEQAWLHYDSNKDGYLSEQEVRAALEELQLGPSSNAEMIFGSMDLKNTTSLETMFHSQLDENSDGYVTQSEFESGYMDYVDLYEWLETASVRPGTYILENPNKRSVHGRKLFKMFK